jgi:hypothetical protein
VLDAAARTTTPALATTATVVNPIEEEAEDVILTFSSESDVQQHLTAMNLSVVFSATSRAATSHQGRRGFVHLSYRQRQACRSDLCLMARVSSHMCMSWCPECTINW